MVTGLMDSITPSFVINSPEGIGRKHWTRYIWTICLPARSMAAGVYLKWCGRFWMRMADAAAKEAPWSPA